MILVDTDVLISHLRGIPEANDWLRDARTEGPIAASVIAITELVGGMRSQQRREVTRLLGSLRIVPVNELVGYRAGEFRRRYRRSHSSIGTADYLVAATADVHGLRLATLNVRHFPMFRDLEPPWPTSPRD
jgi:predicted nucleic acid-binding protein